MTPLEELEANPLYDVALMEIVGVLPPQLPSEIPMDVVRQMMIVCWIRGVSWREEQYESARAE